MVLSCANKYNSIAHKFPLIDFNFSFKCHSNKTPYACITFSINNSLNCQYLDFYNAEIELDTLCTIKRGKIQISSDDVDEGLILQKKKISYHHLQHRNVSNGCIFQIYVISYFKEVSISVIMKFCFVDGKKNIEM